MDVLTPEAKMTALLNDLKRFREDTFFSLMQALVSNLRDINDPMTLELFKRSKHFREYQSFFISQQSFYYHAIELAEALSLKKKLHSGSQALLEILDLEFSRNAYLRMKDTSAFMDFSRCETFIMVGCGPLPASLFYIHENTDVQAIIGLDNNREAVDSAKELIERLEFPRIHVRQTDGRDFDYEKADVIYVANLASPKRSILNQILETAKKDVQVILRDPYGFGILLSESGMEALDHRFQLTGEGIENEYFLSKHFFLKK